MKRRRVKTEENMQEEGELEGEQSNLRQKAVWHVISLLTLFSKRKDRLNLSSERADPSGTALARISSNSKLQTRTLVREEATKITNRNCLKENLKEKEKLVAGPRWAPDTRTD
jgi:hypothetical protein